MKHEARGLEITSHDRSKEIINKDFYLELPLLSNVPSSIISISTMFFTDVINLHLWCDLIYSEMRQLLELGAFTSSVVV